MQKGISHAKDYVEMQWLMLQQDEPEDYVIASGRINREKICLVQRIGWNCKEVISQ